MRLNPSTQTISNAFILTDADPTVQPQHLHIVPFIVINIITIMLLLLLLLLLLFEKVFFGLIQS